MQLAEHLELQVHWRKAVGERQILHIGRRWRCKIYSTCSVALTYRATTRIVNRLLYSFHNGICKTVFARQSILICTCTCIIWNREIFIYQNGVLLYKRVSVMSPACVFWGLISQNPCFFPLQGCSVNNKCCHFVGFSNCVAFCRVYLVSRSAILHDLRLSKHITLRISMLILHRVTQVCVNFPVAGWPDFLPPATRTRFPLLECS